MHNTNEDRFLILATVFHPYYYRKYLGVGIYAVIVVNCEFEKTTPGPRGRDQDFCFRGTCPTTGEIGVNFSINKSII
jgi:hypothetical protein